MYISCVCNKADLLIIHYVFCSAKHAIFIIHFSPPTPYTTKWAHCMPSVCAELLAMVGELLIAGPGLILSSNHTLICYKRYTCEPAESCNLINFGSDRSNLSATSIRKQTSRRNLLLIIKQSKDHVCCCYYQSYHHLLLLLSSPYPFSSFAL